jgi:hypothetical protein
VTEMTTHSFFDRLSGNRIAVVLFALALVLIFYNLGGRRLFMDECYMASIAQNTLQNGYPSCWNGHSFNTLGNGIDFNQSGVMIYFPWLTPYLMALSHWLLGKSELATRLPFALLGLVSIVYYYLTIKRLSANPFVVLSGLALYVLSVPMLLYFRSAHYYASVIAFTNMSLYYYLSTIASDHRPKDYLLLGLSLTLLFHSNFGLFVVPCIVFLLYTGLWLRQKRALVLLVLTYVAVAALTAPWFLYKAVTTQGTVKGIFMGLIGVESVLTRLFEYAWKVQSYFFPILSLGVIYGLLVLIRHLLAKPQHTLKDQWDRRLVIPILFIVVNLACIVVLDPTVHTRRLLPSMTMFYILLPWILWQIHRHSKTIGYLTFMVLLLTNWLQILPWRIIDWSNIPAHHSIVLQSPVTLASLFHGNTWSYAKYESVPRYYLFEFLQELGERRGEYKTRIGAVIDYLNKHAAPGETVLACNVETPQIQYYTDLRVVNQLNPERAVWGPFGRLVFTAYPSAQKFREQDHVPDDQVDWIIYQSRIPFPFEDLDHLDKNRSNYEEIPIDGPDALVEGLAEINYHVFQSPQHYQGFSIYKRKKASGPSTPAPAQ